MTNCRVGMGYDIHRIAEARPLVLGGVKFDSAWGLTAHRVRMLICERCQYVLSFYEGNTIFDFD